MPTLSITLTTAQSTRAKDAFAFLNGQSGFTSTTPATQEQIEAWILRQVKNQVRSHEERKAGGSASADAESTLASEGW
jgi:hypothetical protein